MGDRGSENGSLRRAITSLAQIEERLRRALGLVGDVGATFTPNITPVIIAGDASAPGNPSFRGRRFQFGLKGITTSAANTWGLKAAGDIVITRIWHVGTANLSTQISWFLIAPGIADDFAITNAVTPFVERNVSANDLAPLLTAASGGAVGVFTTGRMFARHGSQSGGVDVSKGGIMLPTGGRIQVTTSAAVVDDYVLLEGYVY
jgi:hypothetical protein